MLNCVTHNETQNGNKSYLDFSVPHIRQWQYCLLQPLDNVAYMSVICHKVDK